MVSTAVASTMTSGAPSLISGVTTPMTGPVRFRTYSPLS